MEMLQLLSTLPTSSPEISGLLEHFTFLIAENDTSSESKLKLFLEPYPHKKADIFSISRARRVGQSWWTTPWTSLLALFQSFQLLLNLRPHLILCNGPGTCIPICAAANILKVFFRLHIVCFYIESPIAVQWPTLKMKYPRTYHKGILV
ncbi:UDP-N-acetylglucosamine transferase subunit [Coelomomyces lativittatus]|nr:UDP-N-acetylglucosamine transferase subunit [Coelomomyces lativittatus]